MENDPLSFPPLEAEVDDFGVDEENRIWIRIRLEDGRLWTMDLATEDSPEARDILDGLARVVTRSIERLAGHGVVTGLTPSEPEEDEE